MRWVLSCCVRALLCALECARVLFVVCVGALASRLFEQGRLLACVCGRVFVCVFWFCECSCARACMGRGSLTCSEIIACAFVVRYIRGVLDSRRNGEQSKASPSGLVSAVTASTSAVVMRSCKSIWRSGATSVIRTLSLARQISRRNAVLCFFADVRRRAVSGPPQVCVCVSFCLLLECGRDHMTISRTACVRDSRPSTARAYKVPSAKKQQLFAQRDSTSLRASSTWVEGLFGFSN